MAFSITTTGTVPSVVLDDLGARTLTHPSTTDLQLEYGLDELFDSESVSAALSSGEITIVHNGQNVTDLSDYRVRISDTDISKISASESDIADLETDVLNLQSDVTNLQNSKLDTVQAGSNVTIDNTDPLNPIINATSSGSTDFVKPDFVRVTNSASQAINATGATGINADTIDQNTNTSLFSLVGNEVIVAESGRYVIKAIVSINSPTVQRADPLVKVYRNGLPIQDSLGRDISSYGMYARNSGAIDNSSEDWEYTLDLNANDSIQAYLDEGATLLTDVTTIVNGTYLEIRRLEATRIGDTQVSWANYADDQYDTGSRLSLTGGVRVKLPNNAANTINTYMPSGVEFYDGISQKITPAAVGETYELRINFKGESSTNNNYAAIELDIGGTQGTIIERTITFPRGSNVEHSFSTTTSIFCLETFITNGGEIFITPNNQIQVWDISFMLVRNSAATIDIPEAPVDGITYGRNNGDWTPITGATILTAQETITQGSWSGNTDYQYSVSVPDANIGDFCLIEPDEDVYQNINNANTIWNGYAYCGANGTVTAVCRIGSFINIPAGSIFTVKVIK